MRKLFGILLLFFSFSMICESQVVRIDSDFPGGNIIIESINGDTVWLKPDIRDTEGDWFYWYFKITGIQGRTITFQFTQDNVFAKYGPAYTVNEADAWKWLGEQSYHHNQFSYSFTEADTCAWFAMSYPYTQLNLKAFLKNVRNTDSIVQDTLCFTKGGRAVEQINIGNMVNPTYRVLLTARHHACEMIANYVMEGIIESVLNESGLAFLRDEVAFRMIPFVDKDGVENGDQGKNRIPRDHNRDYNKESLYNTTKTLRGEIPAWSQGMLKMAIDLHCPWIKGDYNEFIYMVGSVDTTNQEEQLILSQLIEQNTIGEVKYLHANFLPHGQAWNTSKNYTAGKSFTSWSSALEGISVASAIEFPYANVSGVQVSKDNAREFGKAVAYAIQDYLTAKRR